jgi:hypothetical protein
MCSQGPYQSLKEIQHIHVYIHHLFRPKKLLILSVNGVLCYFPPSVVLNGNVRVFGKNVDKAKVEVRVGVEDFLVKAFEKFYITIWSCMKLEDVLEVFRMFVPENFVDQFIFVWGCE